MASIEPNKTTKLNELKINLVDTKATFQAMQQAEVVESNQLYFIEENDDYTLPIASDNVLGGIKTGYPTSGKTYGVTVNSNGQAYVTVNWENTQTITGVKGGDETNYRTGDVNITKANIGLGNVENTKLSTWTGSNKITTVGTLSSGTVPWARLSGVPNGATKEGTVTSLTIKTTSPIAGGSDTATTTTGSYTIALTDAYGDTKNPYGSKTKNYVLAAPSTAAGDPSFRALVSADIPNLNASKIIAGQFSNDRLANSKVTIAGNDVSLGGNLTADTLRESLGLSNAMHFIGVATVAITDGSTDDPVIPGYSTKTAGDVIIDKDSSYEYVWSSANKWERLGGDSSYKTKQTAVSSPSANGSTTAFIDTISQNANGVITVTKKNLDTSGTWSGNAGSATKLETARSLTTKLNSTTAVTFDGSADQNTIPVTGILPIANGGTGTNTLTSGEALIGNGTSAITTRAITNNTTATVAAKTNNLITNNTLYYATASINNARQTNNVSIYAPTTAGTANQILVSKGGTSAPDWKATANGAAYATSTNGALTFGTLPIAQGGTGQTTWTADGLLYASATTTLASKVPAWQDWTAGTTAGPKAKIQLGNKSYESAAIPSASVSASGVVTTGAQNFKGRKGFNLINRYGKKDDGTTARWTGDTMLYNGAATPVIVGEYWYDYGDATNITKGQYFWRQYSPNSTSNTTTTTKYETYSLPNVTSGLSANKDYSILTSKETITVEQGGTGVTSIANIKAGKDGNGNTISSTYLKLSGGTMTGTIKRAGAGGNWQSGRDRALICMNSLDSYSTLASMKTDNGSWDIGAYSNQSYTDDLIFSYIKDTTYSGTNGTDAQIRFLEDSGVQANKFVVTSVSYGDASNRPSNPTVGQLYFQFID